MCLGTAPDGSDVDLPFHSILPMVGPDDIIFDGWDLSSFNLADSMERAQVLDYNLQVRLISEKNTKRMCKKLKSVLIGGSKWDGGGGQE